MHIVKKIEQSVIQGVQTLFGQELDQVEFVPTRKDFEG